MSRRTPRSTRFPSTTLFRSEVEQVVLDVGERGADRLRQRLALQDADRRIQLVDTAYGLDPRAVLGGPAAVAQPGRTVVAGAGGDRGESESHHCLRRRARGHSVPPGVLPTLAGMVSMPEGRQSH